jgi:predicted nucleotidyltransferase component of viral defense system
MALSDLQRRVASIVMSVPGGESFALAGGGALLVLGVVDRTTRDLDYFTTSPSAVEEVVPRVAAALEEAGINVARNRIVAGFARLSASDGAEETVIDFALDSRIFEAVSTPLGPVLALDELAADKMLALFSRAEARDFVDVHQLRSRYSRAELSSLATRKDPGFHAEGFVDALTSISRHDRTEFDVDDGTFRLLRHEFAGWREELRSD